MCLVVDVKGRQVQQGRRRVGALEGSEGAEDAGSVGLQEEWVQEEQGGRGRNRAKARVGRAEQGGVVVYGCSRRLRLAGWLA
jgi:hypothetical protein